MFSNVHIHMLLHVPTFFEKQHNNIGEVYTMTKQSDMQSFLRPLQSTEVLVQRSSSRSKIN